MRVATAFEKIPLVRLESLGELDVPCYETAGSAGMDVRAAIDGQVRLMPGESALIPCGFKMALPSGLEAQIRPRSGLALKHNVTVLNAPGTIDSDYRGEVCVLLINLGGAPFWVKHGMRIAQVVIAPVIQFRFMPVPTLGETVRGAGGFGSTGVS